MKRKMAGPNEEGLIPPKTKCKYHGSLCFDHSCVTVKRANCQFSCGLARMLKLTECCFKNVYWRPKTKMILEDHEYQPVDLANTYNNATAARLVKKLESKFKYVEFVIK